jgi:hypothetical protein
MGNTLTISPSAHLVSPLEWKTSFVHHRHIDGPDCTAVFKVVRDGPGTPKGEWLREHVPDKGKKKILGRLAFWQISMAAFFRNETFVAIRGLGEGPYPMEVFGYSPTIYRYSYILSIVVPLFPIKPYVCAIPTLAFLTCRAPAWPRSCVTTSTTCQSACAPIASPKEEKPPLGHTATRPPICVSPSLSILSASPSPQKPHVSRY